MTKTKLPEARRYEPVPGDPVKSFFVEMLTRDIQLEDAILDLLDNCVDGVLRSHKTRRASKNPYEGFSASIKFDSTSFDISDNCGGIPWDLHEYAFRLGNANPTKVGNLPTVGFYGIGMKRAIFKIGLNATIQTQNAADAYDVNISPSWLKDENDWAIPVTASKSRTKEDGTTIVIDHLRNDVKAQFGRHGVDAFQRSLSTKIATHYAFIIAQGFEVKVNGERITPRPTQLRFEDGSRKDLIRPFIYETESNGVSVFLAVGFTRPIPSDQDIEEEATAQRYSSDVAGWTVVCNDRAVLYANRDELTGWGESGVPKYHTQFTAIAGVVEFRSNDPSKLPTNTTKRGIDGTSTLYLQVKNKMREGMQLFTDFTNQWKGVELAKEAKSRIAAATVKSLQELRAATAKLPMSKTQTGLKGSQYKPKLPRPSERERANRKIMFSRPISEIRTVAEFLFDDPDRKASDVGSESFARALRDASR